jgi:hypothetical protein
MTDLLQISIPDIAICRRRGYIYSIYAYGSNFRVVYIGQTAVREGALGRLSQHLGDGHANTFRQRLHKYEMSADLDLAGLKEIEFATVPLNQRQEFQGRARSHREAVEYLVQAKLNYYQESLGVTIISTVRKNGYCDVEFIENEACLIANELLHWLSGAVFEN